MLQLSAQAGHLKEVAKLPGVCELLSVANRGHTCMSPTLLFAREMRRDRQMYTYIYIYKAHYKYFPWEMES